MDISDEDILAENQAASLMEEDSLTEIPSLDQDVEEFCSRGGGGSAGDRGRAGSGGKHGGGFLAENTGEASQTENGGGRFPDRPGKILGRRFSPAA